MKFQALATPYRFRVQPGAGSLPIIPGRYGQIEWYCDGVNCSSCALPGQFALAVYTDRPRLFQKIWAIPEVKQQTGDTEMLGVFPPEVLEQVAALIRTRQKRTQASPRSLQNLRPRVTSRTQESRLPYWAGPGLGATLRRAREAAK